MKAIWNDKVIAQSNDTIVIENNHYFPESSVQTEYLQKSETTTHCPWKGDASYYNIVVDGKVNQDAAWYYANPKYAAKTIKNHIAFWKGVTITE